MKYEHLSLDEILAKVDEKYSREEQNDIAFELVDSLMDSTDDLEEDFDAMAYLAEYFSTGEYKEWLCDTFLSDEDEVYINCKCGDYRCVKRYNTELGDIIDIYDADDDCVGFIRGNLDNFTEEKLIEDVEDEVENHWNDIYVDNDEDDWDD